VCSIKGGVREGELFIMFGGAGIKSEWDAMMGAQQKTLENCFARCSIWDLSYVAIPIFSAFYKSTNLMYSLTNFSPSK